MTRNRPIGKPRARVAGIRLELLRRELADGDKMLTTRKAAAIVRAAQLEPTVTRQLIELWARRHGTKGESYVQEETSWRQYGGPVLVSLSWLTSFLERTGRANG